MKCPACGSLNNRVTNSRLTSDESSIRRRRECDDCGGRFTTFEYVEKTPLIVIKRDGTRQNFNREKIVQGLMRSCEKRSVPFDEIQRVVAEIERELESGVEKEVSSLRIGEMVLRRLRSLDEVAYVRFASVYRSFRDVGEFSEEVQSLLRNQAAAESAEGKPKA